MLNSQILNRIGIPAIALALVPLSTLGFELPKALMVSLYALGCSLLLTRLPAGKAGWVFAGYSLILVLSPLWSIAPVQSILGAAPRYQGVLLQVLFLILALHAMREPESMVQGLQIANILVVGYGILQMMHVDLLASFWKSEAFLGRTFSTIGHPNMLGQFILLTAPFLVYRSRRQPVVAALLLLNIILLLGTVSRSAMLGAVIMLLPFASHIRRIRAGQAFAASFLIVLCTAIALLFAAQRFSQSYAEGRSVSSRALIWRQSIVALLHRPIGYGAETMGMVSPQYMGKDLYRYESLTTTVDRAHNEPLHIAVTLGPVAAFLYVTLLWMLLAALWRQRSSAPAYLQAAGAGLLGYSVTLLFGFSSNATAPLSWILIGLLLGGLKGMSSGIPRRWQRAVQWSALCIALVSTVVSALWIESRLSTAKARAAGTYLDAVMQFRYDRDLLIEATEAHLFTLEQATEQRDVLIQSIDTLMTLLRSVTGNHDGFADLLAAWLAAIEGDRDGTLKYLKTAEQLLPTSITLHRTALHCAELLQDGVMAERHRMAIRGLLPDAFFDEGSMRRRILLKENGWLEDMLR